MKTIAVRIDGELEERFNQFCSSHLIKPSDSQIARTALDFYLKHRQQPEPKRKKVKHTPGMPG